jgi:hypothetical protein
VPTFDEATKKIDQRKSVAAIDKKKPEEKIPGLWIRIRIGSGFRDLVDPDPYWESGSRGKKTKKFQWEKSTFWLFFKKNSTTEKV